MLLKRLTEVYLENRLIKWYGWKREGDSSKFCDCLDTLIEHSSPTELKDLQDKYNPIHVYCRFIDKYGQDSELVWLFVKMFYEPRVMGILYDGHNREG